ncbi:MAG: hypothetical protein ACR2LT_01085 [Pyrinomonadaceae bacterium]
MSQNAWNLTYREVIGLTTLAYKDYGKTAGSYRLPGGNVWTVTEIIEMNSFRAIIAAGKAGKIMSFSGSDDPGDWAGSGAAWDGTNLTSGLYGSTGTDQYEIGAARAVQRRPDMVVGHSLGGGIASYVTYRTGIKSVTINPAPLVGTEFVKFRKTPLVINYVVEGEALSYARKIYPCAGQSIIVYSSASGMVNKHCLPWLTGFSIPEKIS